MALFTAAPVESSSAGITITLPAGAVGKVNWYFVYRAVGSTLWHYSYALVVGGVVQTRIQKPIIPIEYFMHGVDSTGVVFDSEISRMSVIDKSTVVTVTEIHVPERAKVGEKVSAHAFSYDVQNGSIVGTIVDPARAVTAPFGTSMTHVAAGKFAQTGTVALDADSGTHHHAFAFAA